MTTTVQLETHFSCAHFYNQKKWSEQKNQETFGKCFNPHGHGHDYKLAVAFHIANEEEKKTANTALAALREKLDHQHLNYSIPEFSEQIPTTENLAHFCLQFLKKEAANLKILSLELYETEDIWVKIDQL